MHDYIPPEIWVEILHRLPIKSLVICTSVCKAWKSLITNHAFTYDLFTRTLEAIHGSSSLFIESYNATLDIDEFYSLSLHNHQTDCLSKLKFPSIPSVLDHTYKLVIGSCNGLVCIANYSTFDSPLALTIWNPSIRKYLMLPEFCLTLDDSIRQYYWILFGFGYDSRNKDFKVVRIVILNNEHDAQIYSVASASWRSITARAPPFMYSKDELRTSKMFMNGALHWVVKRESKDRIYNSILSFNVSEETFGELMLPHCLQELHGSSKVDILQADDSLTVVQENYSVEYFLSIWVMKEYGRVKSWTQVFHINPICYGGVLDVIAYKSNGEVILESSGKGIKIMDPKKEFMKDLGGATYFSIFVGLHADSLFLLDKEYNASSY